jgi:queuosine precursor transporter
MVDPPPQARTGREYKYFDLIMAGFVAVLLCSNLIGPAKTCRLELPFGIPGLGREFTFGAGNLFFPISYVFGDVLTEVYGYARARRTIWAGFLAMLFATLMSQVVLRIPADPSEPFNTQLEPALHLVFGGTWRIVVASILAFWAGDFVNSYVLARMKVLSAGRHLWMRTIGSTLAGQAVDSLLFYPVAFYGLWNQGTLLRVMVFAWCMKVGFEALVTPITYAVVGFLKRAEREDYYDRDTQFTPFSLKT